MNYTRFFKSVIMFLFLGTFLNCKSQQVTSYWTSVEKSKNKIILNKSSQRTNFPKEFKLFELNVASFKETIFKAVGNKNSIQIVLPNSKGQFETFEVFESSGFAPELQAQFPDLRSFTGKGITDNFANVTISYSPNGINVMILRADKPSEFIEAYSEDYKIYAVFNKSDKDPNWNCTTPVR